MSLRNGNKSARNKATKGNNRQAIERACRGALGPVKSGFEALEDRKLFAIVAPAIRYDFDDNVGAVSSTRPTITDSAALDGAQNGTLTGSVPADAAKILAGGAKATSTGYLSLGANNPAFSSTADQGRVDIADIHKYLRGTGSLALWLRTTMVSPRTEFWASPAITGTEEGGAGDDVFWGSISDTGRISIGKDQVVVQSPNPINNGQWQHFVFTRLEGNGMVRLYINGLLAASLDGNDGAANTPFRSIGASENRQQNTPADSPISATPPTANASGTGINIGDPTDSIPLDGHNGRSFFVGDMDEVEVFNVELQPADVIEMYAAKGPVQQITGAETQPNQFGITVRWDTQPNALNYRIFKADFPAGSTPDDAEFSSQNPNGPYATVPGTLSGKVEFKDGAPERPNGLAPGMTRYYKIVPVNALNETTIQPGNLPTSAVTSGTTAAVQRAGATAYYFNSGFWGRPSRNNNFDVRECAYVPATNNFTPVKPQFSETVPNINFDYGGNTPVLGNKNANLGNGDNHSTMFTGKLKAPFTGEYTLLGYGDDDTYLYVNGKLASFDPLGHGIRDPRTSTTGGTAFPMTLTQGQEVNFVAFQAEQGGGSGIRLERRRPNANNSAAATQEIIPASAYVGNLPNAAGGESDGRPAAPTNLALSPNDIGASRYVLTWNDNATNEVRYTLQRSLNDPTFSSAVDVEMPVNRTFHAETGQNPGITYQYRVRADNLFGQSTYSNTLAVLPDNKNGTTEPGERPAVDLPPAAPSGVAVWNRTEGMYLSFQDNSLVEFQSSTNPVGGFDIDRFDLTNGTKWISITGGRDSYLPDEDPNGSINVFTADQATEIFFGSPGARRVRLIDRSVANGSSYIYRVRTRTTNFTGGSFRIVSAFSPASNSATAGPTNPLATQGFRARYFDNIDFTGPMVEVPAATHVDSDLNVGNASPVAGIGVDNLSGILEGEFLAQTTEDYTFVLATDDGAAFRLIDPTIQPAQVDDPATPRDERNAHVLIDFDNLGIGRGLPDGNVRPPIFSDKAGVASLVRGRKYIVQFRWNEGGGGAGYKIGYVSDILTNGVPEIMNNAGPQPLAPPGAPDGRAEMISKPTEATPQVPASNVVAFENLRNELFAVRFNDTNLQETGYRLMRSLNGTNFVEATRVGPVTTGGSAGTAGRTTPVTIVDDLGLLPDAEKPAFGSTVHYKIETLGNSANTQFFTSNTVTFTPQDTNSKFIQVNNNATVVNRSGTEAPTNENTINDDLRLTDNANDQRGSGYMIDGRDFIQAGQGTNGSDGFNLEFDFQVRDQTGANQSDPADGFAFVMQRTSKFATGGGGGASGYSGIGKSAAVKFDIWPGPSGTPPTGGGRNQTGLYRNGENVNDAGIPTNLPFATDDRVYVVKLSYNHTAKTLTQTITDKLDPTKTFTTMYGDPANPHVASRTPVDLKTLMGGESAWIGFTGATGGLNAEQHILGFHYNGDRIFGPPKVGPKVTDVFARGTTGWSQGFRNFLADVNDANPNGGPSGDVDLGHKVTAGESLPWSNLNQVSVRFDMDVAASIAAGDLVLKVREAGQAADSTVGTAFVGYNAATRTATWTLPTNLNLSKVLLTIDDAGVSSADGSALDGDGANGPGGDFNFRFNVVPGDVTGDGQVNVFDTLAVKAKQGSHATNNPANYAVRHDFNTDGQINVFDTLGVKAKQGTRASDVPGEPAPSFAALFSSTRIGEGEEEEAPLI